jgi:hypothetical protein
MEKLQEAYPIKTKMTATDFVMLILEIAYNFLEDSTNKLKENTLAFDNRKRETLACICRERIYDAVLLLCAFYNGSKILFGSFLFETS